MNFLLGLVLGALLLGCFRDWRNAALEAERDYWRWEASKKQLREWYLSEPVSGFSGVINDFTCKVKP